MEEQVQAVTADDQGNPEVADADYLSAVGLGDEVEKTDPPKETPVEEKPKEEKPKEEPKEEKPKEEVQETNPPKKKIKWQGQDVEIEPDKENEFIQKGFDYTKKMQQLAAEREIIAPYAGVIKAMQSDPTLQKKIAEHLSGTKEEPQQFDDPIEQLKYETRQEVLKEVESKFIKPLTEQNQLSARQIAINQVRAQVQTDPLYPKVQEAILGYIQGFPKPVADNLYLQLDQDPESYIETYKTFREKLPKEDKPPEVKPPAPVKKEEHAPILESANSAPTETSAKKDETKVKELNKKYRQTGDLRTLAELIERGGMMKGIIDV